jgi:hypothetical protein
LLLLGWSLLTLSKTRWEINPTVGSSVLMIAGMLLLMMAAMLGWRSCRVWLSSEKRIALELLLLWGVVMTVRSIVLEPGWVSVRNALGNRYFAFAWLVPAVMILGSDLALLRQLLMTMAKQGAMGLAIWLIGLSPALGLLTDFQMTWGCSAALIFWHYLPRWARWTALAGALLHLGLQTMAASRNEMLGHGLLLLAAGFVAARREVSRQLGVLLVSGLMVAAGYYVASHDRVAFLSQRVNARLVNMKQEFWVNSRVSDQHNIYGELLDSLTSIELAIGRGSLGTYRSAAAMASKDTGRDMSSYHLVGEKASGIRQVIECGYLFIILKGGVILLLAMLVLILPALWVGLFRSANWLVRGFAFTILAWLVEMVPFGLPSAFPRYALFWIAVGVCLNPRLRALSDQEVERFFFPGVVGDRRTGWQRPRPLRRRDHRAGESNATAADARPAIIPKSRGQIGAECS